MPRGAQKPPFRARGTREVMGTFVTVIVVCPDPEQAKWAVDLAFGEISKIADLMSVHKPGSEVSELNRDGFREDVSFDTRFVIQRANYFSEISDGAFDITVLPVLKVWESHAAKQTLPLESELKEKLQAVGYSNVIVEGNRVSFGKKGMGITLAGAAKGYAVDRAIEILRRNGIGHALVDGGGDIRTLGGRTDEAPWKIGLPDPLNKRGRVECIALRDQAVATSGTQRRAFNDLLDPRSGRPAAKLLNSTVMAETALDADVLATAFFVLGAGKREGMRLLERFGGAQAFYTTGEGRFFKTGPLGVDGS